MPAISTQSKTSVLSFVIHFMAFLVLALAVGGENCWASTAPSGNLIFILDASGSMGAKIQGKMKIDIAKEVLSGLIRDIPAGVNVGLVAYGHRQKADCDDVEELAALGPLDREPLIAKINSLDHKGKTPITRSVQIVAEGLKSLENETTIVLVSDGEETCDGDPCAMVKELKASGIKFVMHVIGFDVTEKEKTQLSCLAEAGGGTYFTAKNAGEFLVAAKKVVEKTEQSAGTLKMKAIRNGKPLNAWYEVIKANPAGNTNSAIVATNPINEKGEELKLIPGIYDLIIRNQEDAGNPEQKFPGITIEVGKSVEKIADFSGGTLKIKALRNGRPFRAWYEVFKAGADENVEKESVATNPINEKGEEIKLIPGVYDLTIRNQEDAGNPEQKFPGITIEAGKSVEKIADFSGGTLKVKALKGGKAIGAWYEVFKDEVAASTGLESIASNPIGEEGEEIKLVPGMYKLTIRNQVDPGNPVQEFSGVTIKAGLTVEKIAEF